VISPDSVETAVECTHCHVVMTSWSVPGSPIRYYQCPFCARTHSSCYGEVFRRRAGVRVLEGPPRPADPHEIPTARPEDVRWAAVKTQAARWFARLEAEQQRLAVAHPPAAPRTIAVANDDDVVEAVPVRAAARK